MANGAGARSEQERKNLLRTLVAVVFSLVGALILASIVAVVQPRLNMAVQRGFNVGKIETIRDLLSNAAEDEQDIVDNYDSLNIARVDTVALYIRTVEANGGFAYTDEAMDEIIDRLSVSALMITDDYGAVYCQAGDPSCVDVFTTAPQDDELSAPFTVHDKDSDLRFYAAAIDADHFVVIADVPEETERYVEEVASLSAVLGGVRVGQNGFVFAVDAKTGTIAYFPEGVAGGSSSDASAEGSDGDSAADSTRTLVGTSAIDAGLTAGQLTKGYSGTVEVDGVEYFATVGLVNGYYMVAVNPIKEFYTHRNAAINGAVIVFLFVTLLVVAYCTFARRESCRPDEAHYRRVGRSGKLLYDLKVGRGAVPLAVAGLLIGTGCTIFVQTIYSVATQSVTNDARVSEAVEALSTAESRYDRLESEASESAVEKAKLAAYVIARTIEIDEDLLTRDYMIELRDCLQATGVWLFDLDGNTVATDGEYWGYRLSDDEAAFSYKFRKILLGRTISVVSETDTDKHGFVATRYAGYAVQDENLETVGAFELGVKQDRLNKMEDSTSLSATLERLQIGNNGFAFAVNKADGTFAYHPNSNLEGALAADHGITSAQLIGGYSDYMSIDGESYLVSSKEYGDMLVYVAVPASSVNSRTLGPVTFLGFLFAMVWLNLIVAWMTLVRRSSLKAAPPTPAPAAAPAPAPAPAPVTAGAFRTIHPAEPPAEDVGGPGVAGAGNGKAAGDGGADGAAVDGDGVVGADGSGDDSYRQMIDVDVSEGHTVKTRSALSRWTDVMVRWRNKTAGQKTFAIMRVALGLLAAGLLVLGALGSRVLPDNSALLYILNGRWSKGPNLFGVTQCVMAIVVVYVGITVMSSMFLWFAKSMNAKGETIFRLLANVVKFVGFIGSVYYCLGCLGVDTTTLLASAGILTVIVGLGANSIVTDILAGLLIVFEGEFQVGDIVTIGGVRGTVLEIGVRTTKIKDSSGNVKVFANRNVSDVLNMTKDYSVVALDVSVYFGGSLDEVEQKLVTNLPLIRERIPAITDGPSYKGLDKVYGSVAEFKVVASCAESNIGQVTRDLRRELQRVLKDYTGVTIG